MNAQKKILLVEDDMFILDIYQSKLRNEGYEVVSAENGLDALKKLESFAPDLIVSDMTMPYMDGLELLKRLKAHEAWKDIPVMMMTNISEEEKITEAQEEGIADYLVKSQFMPSEVLDKIKALLGS